MTKPTQTGEINEHDVANDPSTSYWLKEQIIKSKNRDPVDMLNDIQVLINVLNTRINN